MNAAPGKSYPSRRRGPQAKTLTAFLRAMSSRMACRTRSAAKCARNEIDRLEELGLVKRCHDPDDRRIWRLQLTPAAGPILREIQRLRAKLHSVMTKGIDRAVLDAMITGLRQMKQNVSSQRLAKASA